MIELNRISNEEFEILNKEIRGFPSYFTVLNTGQILLWPALDTSQVIIKIDLT